MTEPLLTPLEMFSTSERSLLDFVGAQAATNLPRLEVSERIKLLQGLALILPAAEAEQCLVTVAALERAEAAQLILGEMLAGVAR
jgi:hypothetical protein